MPKPMLFMGAVAYAPKAVTIWDGFKEYFSRNGFSFDYVLYSNHERQVEAMFEGAIHVAWNSPLAWIRAARMIGGNHLAFINEGTLPAGQTRVLPQTPAYDHCNFSVSPGAPANLIAQYKRMLLSMSYADAEIRPLLDLEGLKEWKTGRTQGYRLLEDAVNETGFYDASGNITVAGYRY
jgi:ABC-type phosphate/phosphonate transport system substrate-binding protein